MNTLLIFHIVGAGTSLVLALLSVGLLFGQNVTRLRLAAKSLLGVAAYQFVTGTLMLLTYPGLDVPNFCYKSLVYFAAIGVIEILLVRKYRQIEKCAV